MSKESKQEAVPQEEVLGGFDFKNTHIFDPKSKRIIGKNPYRRMVIEGTAVVEWPVGSGNAWYEDKKFAGRIVIDKDSGKRSFDKGAKHVEWVPPLSADEQLARKVATTEQENKRLQAELAAIKKEQAAATKAPPSASN